MESYSKSLMTKKVYDLGLELVTSKTLNSALGIKNTRSFFRIVQDLLDNGILTSLERDKYIVIGSKQVSSFKIANFFYQPSYISCETALNYWGVLSQFPFDITSVTPKKTITKSHHNTVYSYNHINSKYFGMFTKRDDVLIALAEKALFDQVYLVSKGIKTASFDEYDFKNINKKKFIDICCQFKIGEKILEIVKKYL